MQSKIKTLKICLVILCLLHGSHALGLPQSDGATFFMAIPKVRLVKHPVTGKIIPERWKDVVGYEGLYQVSNYGRVKNLERIVYRGNGNHARRIKERLLKPCADGRGYFTVGLVGRTHKVHVLVANHFLRKKPTKQHQVNHKDRIKSNNYVWNLEWLTGKENIIHSWNVGTRIRLNGEVNPASKLSNKKIIALKKDLLSGRFIKKELSIKYGICKQYLWQIETNKSRRIH